MAIRRPEPEFPHAPGFVSRGLHHLGARSNGSAVEAVNVVDVEVRDVAVVAQLVGRGNVRAAAEHEGDLAGTTESPIARGDIVKFAP